MTEPCWKIYYDLPDIGAHNHTSGEHSFSSYSDLDGTWENAPQHGVICVVVKDPTEVFGRWIHSSYSSPEKCYYCRHRIYNEYYVKRPDSTEPYGTFDIRPFLAYIQMPEEDAVAAGHIKQGRMVDQAYFTRIMDAASKDTDFTPGTPKRRRMDF